MDIMEKMSRSDNTTVKCNVAHMCEDRMQSRRSLLALVLMLAALFLGAGMGWTRAIAARHPAADFSAPMSYAEARSAVEAARAREAALRPQRRSSVPPSIRRSYPCCRPSTFPSPDTI